MPAPQRYPSPSEQLLELARDARSRGLSFDQFWDAAVPPAEEVLDKRVVDSRPLLDEEGKVKIRPSRVLPRVGTDDAPPGAVLWPRDTRERRDAYEATVAPEVREAWRRAYEFVPASPRERSLAALRPFFRALEETELDPEEGDPGGRPIGAGIPLPA